MVVAGKYHSNYRKHRFKIMDKPERQPKQMFLQEDLALEVIKERKAAAANNFRERVRYNCHDVFKTKEQTVLRSILNEKKETKKEKNKREKK